VRCFSVPIAFKTSNMKLRVKSTSLALLCLTARLAISAPMDCEVNGKSVNPDHGGTTAGLTGVMRCLDRATKQLVREQEIQNGAFFGLERFYEKGKLQRDFRTNPKGNKDGIAKTYANGVLVAEEQYDSGANVGLQKFFFESGTLKRLSFYEVTKPISASSPFIETQEQASISLNENGKLSDIRCAKKPLIEFGKISDQTLCGFKGTTQLELFSGDTLTLRKSYLNGENLATVSYWESGKVRSEVFVREGRLFEFRFNQAGTKIKEIESRLLVSSNGSRRLKELERDFHASGTLTNESRWIDGMLSEEKTWYLNGQPKSQALYQGTAVTRSSFHDNGVLAFRGGYRKSRSSEIGVGEHQSFDDQARLRLVQFYDDKGLINRERALDEAGAVVRDDTLFEDGSRKAFAK
jgi:antitoxin component YwqK of YwqJK toxin-antitoxin module